MKQFYIILFCVLCFVQCYGQQQLREEYFAKAIADGDTVKMEDYMYAGIKLTPNHLATAIKKYSTNAVSFILNQGIDPNSYIVQTSKKISGTGGRYGVGGIERTSKNVYLWSIAASSYKREIVRLLLKKHVRISLIPQALIDAAVQKNDHTTLTILMNKGISPQKVISSAQKQGKQSMIDLAQRKGGKISYTSQDLTNAAKRNDFSFVKKILESKKYLNIDTWALVYAIRKGNFPMLKYLIGKGGDPNKIAYGNQGLKWTPICETIQKGNYEMLEYLVREAGASPYGKCSARGKYDNSWSKYFSYTDYLNSGYCDCYSARKEKEKYLEFLLLAPGIYKRKAAEKRKQEEAIIVQQRARKEAMKEQGKNYEKRADVFLKNKQYDEAISLYDSALWVNQTSALRIKKAQALEGKGKYQQAMDLYTKCGTEKACQRGLALCYLKTDKATLAKGQLEVMEKNATTYEEKREIYYGLACVYSSNTYQNETETVSYLKKAFKNGFKDFERINNDPLIAKYRNSSGFQKLVNKYR